MSPKTRRLLIVLGMIPVLMVVVAALIVFGRLRASAPRLEGEVVVAGLTARVEIERDGRGVPRIRAEDDLDGARALGFLHAQDRFFQMDLQRRRAAGELAALVGAAAIELDSKTRVHRFRSRAQAAVTAASAEQQALLEAYAAGVNAGLAELGASPWEYAVLGGSPAPWLPEDSFLVLAGMYLVLQGEDHHNEIARETVREALAPELVAFLYPPGTEWDAPLIGDGFGPPAIPGPELVDPRRDVPAVPVVSTDGAKERVMPGSNNFAVAGSRSANGLPILAGDMHLGLSVPTLWYLAELHLAGRAEGMGRIVGSTLPGTPLHVSGSNGSIAWAYTNGYGDWSDLVVVEEVAGGYRVPGGVEPFEVVIERVEVDGGEAVEVEVKSTRWGPVVGTDRQGRPLARRWVAYEPEGANLGVLELSRATTVAEALALAPSVGIPAQNLLVVDRFGSVGWTVLSAIPRRFGFDGMVPHSWATGEVGWDGWIGSERPSVVDPEDGRLWSANNRVAGGEGLAVIGDGGYDLGARAGQIRDGLGRLQDAVPGDLLAIQLDDRALFLERWRDLSLEVVPAGDATRAAARDLVVEWGGRAATDSVGYRLVRQFRYQVEERLYSWLTSPCLALDEDFSWRTLGQREGALWQLVSTRPEHFLPPDLSSWEVLLLESFDAAVAELTKDGGTLEEATWGARNRTRMRHPLSGAIPQLSRWIDFPSTSLPGDWNMPRVQSPTFGASQRMVVTPGREEEGIYQLPGGQSSHPRSPFYRSGLEAWEAGRPDSLLAGETAFRLVLEPDRAPDPR